MDPFTTTRGDKMVMWNFAKLLYFVYDLSQSATELHELSKNWAKHPNLAKLLKFHDIYNNQS